MTDLQKTPNQFFKFFKKNKPVELPIVQSPTQEEKQKEAQAKLENIFEGLVENRDIEKICMMIKRGFSLNEKHCLKLLSWDDAFIQEAIRRRYYESIRYSIDDKITDIVQGKNKNGYFEFFVTASSFWKKFDKSIEFKDKDYALESYKKYKDLSKILKSHYRICNNSTEITEVSTLLDIYCAIIYEENKDVFLKEFSDMLDQHALGFNTNDTVRENIKTGMRENAQKLHALDIPSDASKLIESINLVCNEVSSQALETIDELEFNNLYKKRLPQIVDEYLSISPRYREKLKNHKEDPELILLESLEEIHQKIENIFDNIQNKKHHRQKVSREYLKTL